jgi:signal transduction histidine kinase/ActR/RegA family two-component response regulator
LYLDTLEGAVVVCDANDSVMFVNRAGERVLSTSRERAAGCALKELAIVEDLAARTRLDDLHPLRGEVLVLQARSEPVLVVRLGSSADAVPATTGSHITTLLAGVMHEINNPLAYALGSLDLALQQLSEMRAQSLPAELRQSLDVVDQCLDNARDGSNRIRVIVKDLLSISRPQPEQSSGVKLEAVLDSAINLAWNEIRHRARLVKSLPRVPPVRGDSARLCQVFLNLLVNAAQAIPEGDVETNEVRVLARHEAGRVIVQIEDTGVGMSEEVVERAFEPFFSTKPAGLGTGLGLAVCRGIVAALGGSIDVSSRLGEGSCFTIELLAATDERASVEPDGKKEEHQVPSARILIIDDEPMLGQTLRLAFRGRHDVEFVTSGRQALTLLEKDAPYDLILCDLMMPDVNGIAVYQEIAEHHPQIESRFVFMTGGAFSERARRFLEQHPGRTLNKPFTTHDIEKLLYQLASGS